MNLFKSILLVALFVGSLSVVNGQNKKEQLAEKICKCISAETEIERPRQIFETCKMRVVIANGPQFLKAFGLKESELNRDEFRKADKFFDQYLEANCSKYQELNRSHDESIEAIMEQLEEAVEEAAEEETTEEEATEDVMAELEEVVEEMEVEAEEFPSAEGILRYLKSNDFYYLSIQQDEGEIIDVAYIKAASNLSITEIKQSLNQRVKVHFIPVQVFSAKQNKIITVNELRGFQKK